LETDLPEGGIVRKRSCTDVFCLFAFLVFVVAMGCATMYGITHGDVWKLTAPIDANKNLCGYGKMKGFAHMFITKWDVSDTWGIFNSGVCVKECP